MITHLTKLINLLYMNQKLKYIKISKDNIELFFHLQNFFYFFEVVFIINLLMKFFFLGVLGNFSFLFNNKGLLYMNFFQIYYLNIGERQVQELLLVNVQICLQGQQCLILFNRSLPNTKFQVVFSSQIYQYQNMDVVMLLLR